MNEIICPHCGKAFKIDETGYADILKQVRDGEFEQQLHERLELAEQDKRNAGEIERRLAVTEALSVVEKERDALANELEQAMHDKQTASKLAEAKLMNELQKSAAIASKVPNFGRLGEALDTYAQASSCSFSCR